MKTHAIVTYSGVHYLITEDQAKRYAQKRLDEEVIVDGCILKMKNVADILTIDKYYETYPKKRDNQVNPILLEGKPFNPETASKKGLEEMIKGLGKYISSTKENPIYHKGENPVWYKGTQEPVELFEKLTKKLEAITK